MFTMKRGRLALVSAVAVGAVVALAGCASGDPLDDGNSSEGSETIVIGSQDYYSNEIIAEIYAQALENGGITVDRQFRIGQREAYLSEIESGDIDVFPEYTGSLLQALDADAPGGTSDEVHTALEAAMPEGLRVLDRADASDQNSWTVTQAFADTYGLTDIASLTSVTEPITVGGNSELETRPYGPTALKEKYGIEIAGFTPVEDSGGPLTVQALKDGAITVGNIYSGDPNIAANELVTLEDPEGLFLASNVVPLVNADVAPDIADIINAIDAKLTAAGLSALNAQSVNDQLASDAIATQWLTENGFLD